MFNRCTILFMRNIPQHIIVNKNHNIVEICFYKYLVIQDPIPKGMNQWYLRAVSLSSRGRLYSVWWFPSLKLKNNELDSHLTGFFNKYDVRTLPSNIFRAKSTLTTRLIKRVQQGRVTVRITECLLTINIWNSFDVCSSFKSDVSCFV